MMSIKKMNGKLMKSSSEFSVGDHKDRVLIIEDEEFLASALRSDLEQEGCVINVATSEDQVMKHIHDYRPHLILLDLLVMKREGFCVVKELKKNPELKPIPVIVSSLLGSTIEIKRALEMGADDYYVKSPYVIDEVIEKMKVYLDGKRTV